MKNGLIIVFLAAAFAVTAHMNYQDGLNDQSFKCKMISKKTWPNVDGFFDRVCKS